MNLLPAKKILEKGFTLVELLVAIAIFASVTIAIANLANTSLTFSTQTAQTSEAINASDYMINQILLFKNDSWFDLITATNDGPKYINLVNEKLELENGITNVDGYDLSFVVGDVYRDPSGDIVAQTASGAVLDPHTRKIDLTAEWENVLGQNKTIVTETYVNDWGVRRITQSTDADFLTGTLNNLQTYTNGDGELGLIQTFYPDWCKPQNSIHYYDLDDASKYINISSDGGENIVIDDNNNSSPTSLATYNVSGERPPTTATTSTYGSQPALDTALDGTTVLAATDDSSNQLKFLSASNLNTELASYTFLNSIETSSTVRLEAENYNNAYDWKGSQPGPQFANGGTTLRNIGNGEWLDFNVDFINGGYYDLIVRAGSSSSNNTAFNIKANGSTIATPTYNTGGAGNNNFSTYTTLNVFVPAGTNTIRWEFTPDSRGRIDYVEFVSREVNSNVDIGFTNNNALVGVGDFLEIIDYSTLSGSLSNTAQIQVATNWLPGTVTKTYGKGNFAYNLLFEDPFQITITDITTPSSPSVTSRTEVNTQLEPVDIYVTDDESIAFVAFDTQRFATDIEAETFSDFFDTSPSNGSGVEVQSASGQASGDEYVYEFEQNEWLEFDVNITDDGFYDIIMFLSDSNTQSLDFEIRGNDDLVLANESVVLSGNGVTNWEIPTISSVFIPSGTTKLKFELTSADTAFLDKFIIVGKVAIDNFYALDLSDKNNALPTIDSYSTQGMSITGIKVDETYEVAMLVGENGEEIQTVDLSTILDGTPGNESMQRCGGMNTDYKLSGVANGTNTGGFAHAYVTSENVANELIVIEGGPGGGDENGIGYNEFGDYTSAIIDTGYNSTRYFSLSWVANEPEDTKLDVQVRGADNTQMTGGSGWIGPDGTDQTYFNNFIGDEMPAEIQGYRYFQYKIDFESSLDKADSSILESITFHIEEMT